MLTQSSVHRQS